MSEMMTIDEVMGHLKLSRATVLRWINSGELPVVKFGNKVFRVRRDDLESWIESKRMSA